MRTSVATILIGSILSVALGAVAMRKWADYETGVKRSEAPRYLLEIRAREIMLGKRFNRYAGAATTPPLPPRGFSRPWPAKTDFNFLGFHPGGKVYFSYSVSGPPAWFDNGGVLRGGIEKRAGSRPIEITARGRLRDLAPDEILNEFIP